MSRISRFGSVRFRLNRILSPFIPLKQYLHIAVMIRMFEGEINLERGLTPPLSITPLSSQESYSLLVNGSGWRGDRGEVKIINQMQTESSISPVDKNCIYSVYYIRDNSFFIKMTVILRCILLHRFR